MLKILYNVKQGSWEPKMKKTYCLFFRRITKTLILVRRVSWCEPLNTINTTSIYFYPLSWRSCESALVRVHNRLQNSPYFCLFKYVRAVKQKVWNEAENRGRVRLASCARVKLLRHALSISLLILREKADCFAVYVHNRILVAIDKRHCVMLLLLDLSAAFDTVDHDILLTRLHSKYSISGIALEWFRSYLTNPSQFALIEGCRSQPRELKCGVPQGSLLGPIL